MNELAVLQREVEVELHLQDGRDLAGTMFVPLIGPDGGPGHLIDRLNEESEEFVALREDQRIHLIHETRILTVRVEDDAVEERVEREIEESPSSHRLLVKMHLTSETEIIGQLSYVQPRDHERLQDYLNTSRRFIPLRVQSQLLYVNRQQVVSVVPLRGE